MDNNPSINIAPSSIETIDGAFLDYVEGLNLECNTINGIQKVPVIWASAERSYQIKNNKEIRDKNGSLIPPIISIDRVSTNKDPQKKGIWQANLSPRNDRVFITKILNQDKTSTFENADSLRNTGQINFVNNRKKQKVVYKHQAVLIPIYVTVEYKINILTNYQSQMNEIVQPFMSRVAQNYFLIKKDGHRYECFMDQNFQQDSIAGLNEEERKYKSTITVKVLGYLIGEGLNQEKKQIEEVENAVEVKFPRENVFLVAEKKNLPVKKQSNQGTFVKSSILRKEVYLIGDGINSQYSVQHSFNSRDIMVIVRENFGNYDQVEVAIDYGDAEHIDIDMGEVIEEGQYSVMILG